MNLEKKTGWRLIHDGVEVIVLMGADSIVGTNHTVFEAITKRECMAEVERLGLFLPEGVELPGPVDPAAPPKSVTNRQFKEALILQGKLDGAQAVIASLPETTPTEKIQKAVVNNLWYNSNEFYRDNATLIAFAPALGMTTPEQIDEFFIYAAGL